MHFICSTYGSAGDVFPMLGLALELRRRGHQITFATNAHYAPAAEKHNLRFEPLGSEDDFQACIANPDVWHPRRAFGHIFRSLQPTLKRQFEIHAAHPTAIGITNCFGLGALMAQDALGVQVFTLHCQPAVLWSDRQPPSLPGLFGPNWLKSLLFRLGERFVLDAAACPFLNPWRRELSLPPVRRITQWWNSPRGVLCMFPDWYAPPQPDWPAHLMQTDFPLWNDASDGPLPQEVENFLAAGTPPFVFAPGSANIHARFFFEAAVQACRSLDRRAVLLTEFPQQLPNALPDSVAHFRYVPLDLLLPRAAAFVHHGGIGSTSQAMRAGIPQVLMPLAHDQFDNAERVHRLGLGDWIASGRFKGPRLAGALTRLLADASVSQACRQAARRLESRDGLRRSAQAIESRVDEPFSGAAGWPRHLAPTAGARS